MVAHDRIIEPDSCKRQPSFVRCSLVKKPICKERQPDFERKKAEKEQAHPQLYGTSYFLVRNTPIGRILYLVILEYEFYSCHLDEREERFPYVSDGRPHVLPTLLASHVFIPSRSFSCSHPFRTCMAHMSC
jgi:hypothetical protein